MARPNRRKQLTSFLYVRITDLTFEQLCVRVGRGSFSVYVRNLIAQDMEKWKAAVEEASQDDPAALLKMQGDTPMPSP